MSLLDLILVYGTTKPISVYELGGAPVVVNKPSVCIPSRFLTCEVFRIYPENGFVSVSIEEA